MGGFQEPRVVGPALLQTASMTSFNHTFSLNVFQQPYLLKSLNWSKIMLFSKQEIEYAFFSLYSK